jgi:hypothetical protein
MTTNVPQDVIDDLNEAAKYADPDGYEPVTEAKEFPIVAKFITKYNQLRAQRQQGAEPVPSVADDLRNYGVAFSRDGKRIAPTDVYIDTTPPQANALVAAAYKKAADGWVSVGDRLPDVPIGEEQHCFLAVRSIKLDKVYVWDVYYINKPKPDDEEDEYPEWVLYDDNGAVSHFVGWAHMTSHPDYNNYYESVDNENIEILAWQPVTYPAYPAIPADAEAALREYAQDKSVVDYLETLGQGFRVSVDLDAAYDGERKIQLLVNRGGVNDPELELLGEGESLRAIVNSVLGEGGK